MEASAHAPEYDSPSGKAKAKSSSTAPIAASFVQPESDWFPASVQSEHVRFVGSEKWRLYTSDPCSNPLPHFDARRPSKPSVPGPYPLAHPIECVPKVRRRSTVNATRRGRRAAPKSPWRVALTVDEGSEEARDERTGRLRVTAVWLRRGTAYCVSVIVIANVESSAHSPE